MHDVLDDAQVQAALKGLDVAWSAIPGQGLVRVFETKNFASGLELVNKLAKLAEEINHHPDIRLGYDEVEVILTTHSAGGVTAHDIELAKAIDSMPQ